MIEDAMNETYECTFCRREAMTLVGLLWRQHRLKMGHQSTEVLRSECCSAPVVSRGVPRRNNYSRLFAQYAGEDADKLRWVAEHEGAAPQ